MNSDSSDSEDEVFQNVFAQNEKKQMKSRDVESLFFILEGKVKSDKF